MLFALNICVNKKAPPTHSVHWGLNSPPPTPAPQKHHSFFFSFLPIPPLPPRLKSANYPSTLF